MDAVRIRRLKRRYRLPASPDDARHRLDRIFGIVLDGRLELALERAGFSPHEQICVRSVSSLFRPRLSLPDETVATHWSLLLAEAIHSAAERRSSNTMVRYASPMHALTDMAAAVLRGDYRHAWAWRQLGLWSAGEFPSEHEAKNEMVRVLSCEPRAVVAVLIALVRLGLTGPLAARLLAEDWAVLAVAAAGAAAAPVDLVRTGQSPAEPPPAGAAQALDACCYRLLQTSKLAALAVSVVDEVLPALALLVLIESDPVLARRARPFLNALLSRVRQELHRRRTANSLHGAYAIETAAQMPEAPGEQEAFADALPTPPRIHGRTDYGGLLFLLAVVEDLGLALRLSETLEPRPLAWALHLLALTLIEAPVDDPAALAFAGLAPDAKPPSSAEAPPSDEELAIIHSCDTAILAELQMRLEHLELPPDQLLNFVCRRPAVITADPGWIEVHFRLEEVSTDLRRVGLDLDPGYMPWLGLVVKFVYE